MPYLKKVMLFLLGYRFIMFLTGKITLPIHCMQLAVISKPLKLILTILG